MLKFTYRNLLLKRMKVQNFGNSRGHALCHLIPYDQKETDAIAIPLDSIYIQFRAVITVIQV